MAGLRRVAAAHAVSLLIASPARAEPGAAVERARVEARFGRGVTFRDDDGAFDLQLRARAQLRYTGAFDEAGDANEAAIRRMRVTLRGLAGHRDLEYYVQLGFATLDTEPDLRVPLRDARRPVAQPHRLGEGARRRRGV